MTRIIAGAVGGRRLRTPRGDRTRPTSERVREALFAALQSQDLLAESRVWDLYAGSGALGLEAASRGAAEVVLVDRARAAIDAARDNVRELGLPQVRVVQAKVASFLASASSEPVDVCLIDPPYDLSQEELGSVLSALMAHLRTGATVIVERSRRTDQPPWPPGLLGTGRRDYGETTLWWARRVDDTLDLASREQTR